MENIKSDKQIILTAEKGYIINDAKKEELRNEYIDR